MSAEQKYALALGVEADRIMARSLMATTNFKRTALYYCRKAQAGRRQIREAV